MPTEHALAQALTAHGYKLTLPRRAVLRAIARAGLGLSPAQIHTRARRYYPRTGLVTVYRTLEALALSGAVRRIHSADGCHTYAPASQGHAHHIVCARCHAVVEFDFCDLAGLLQAVQARTGFQVDDHWLEFSGQCPACRTASRPPRRKNKE